MPNFQVSLRLYPRGFLGGKTPTQVERTPKPFENQLQHHQYRVNTDSSSAGTIVPNTVVESIYSAYVKNCTPTNSFEFRKKILEAALNAFGINDFETWYVAQHKSPAAGDMHRRFLVDTLNFLRTGRRSMSLENWACLIVMTDENDIAGPLPKEAIDFFMIGKQYRRPYPLTEIIQDWCSKPGGLEDLLGTLHILFGDV